MKDKKKKIIVIIASILVVAGLIIYYFIHSYDSNLIEINYNELKENDWRTGWSNTISTTLYSGNDAMSL